jgi:methylmalonyl-CoA decarboxylase
MSRGIIAALESLRAGGVRVVVLRAAAGLRVWSAGHDIDELPRGGRDPLGYNDPLEQLIRAIRTFPAPVIAMVHGSVWGGAFDLVHSCDLVVADETATFAITPANLGLPYNTAGLLHFLGRLPLKSDQGDVLHRRVPRRPESEAMAGGQPPGGVGRPRGVHL